MSVSTNLSIPESQPNKYKKQKKFTSVLIKKPVDPVNLKNEENPNSSIYYFTIQSRPIEKCILDSNLTYEFKSHIIFCIYSNEDSDDIDLAKFIIPLRNKNILPEEIKPIIFVGRINILKKDWDDICVFDKIYIVDVIFDKTYLNIYLKLSFSFSIIRIQTLRLLL